MREGHADITKCTSKGRTAYQTAKKHSYAAVVRILQEVSVVTFLCGHHSRCGANSNLQALPNYVLQEIAKNGLDKDK